MSIALDTVQKGRCSCMVVSTTTKQALKVENTKATSSLVSFMSSSSESIRDMVMFAIAYTWDPDFSERTTDIISRGSFGVLRKPGLLISMSHLCVGGSTIRYDTPLSGPSTSRDYPIPVPTSSTTFLLPFLSNAALNSTAVLLLAVALSTRLKRGLASTSLPSFLIFFLTSPMSPSTAPTGIFIFLGGGSPRPNGDNSVSGIWRAPGDFLGVGVPSPQRRGTRQRCCSTSSERHTRMAANDAPLPLRSREPFRSSFPAAREHQINRPKKRTSPGSLPEQSPQGAYSEKSAAAERRRGGSRQMRDRRSGSENFRWRWIFLRRVVHARRGDIVAGGHSRPGGLRAGTAEESYGQNTHREARVQGRRGEKGLQTNLWSRSGYGAHRGSCFGHMCETPTGNILPPHSLSFRSGDIGTQYYIAASKAFENDRPEYIDPLKRTDYGKEGHLRNILSTPVSGSVKTLALYGERSLKEGDFVTGDRAPSLFKFNIQPLKVAFWDIEYMGMHLKNFSYFHGHYNRDECQIYALGNPGSIEEASRWRPPPDKKLCEAKSYMEREFLGVCEKVDGGGGLEFIEHDTLLWRASGRGREGGTFVPSRGLASSKDDAFDEDTLAALERAYSPVVISKVFKSDRKQVCRSAVYAVYDHYNLELEDDNVENMVEAMCYRVEYSTLPLTTREGMLRMGLGWMETPMACDYTKLPQLEDSISRAHSATSATTSEMWRDPSTAIWKTAHKSSDMLFRARVLSSMNSASMVTSAALLHKPDTSFLDNNNPAFFMLPSETLYTIVSPSFRKNCLERLTQCRPTAVTEAAYVGLYSLEFEYPKDPYTLWDSTLRDLAYIGKEPLHLSLSSTKDRMKDDITDGLLLSKVTSLPARYTFVGFKSECQDITISVFLPSSPLKPLAQRLFPTFPDLFSRSVATSIPRLPARGDPREKSSLKFTIRHHLEKKHAVCCPPVKSRTPPSHDFTALASS
ncbi:hypothetical protein BDR22DRAFT_908245 [Usnea florida]